MTPMPGCVMCHMSCVTFFKTILVTLVEKLPFEYQMVTKTYLPSNLCDSSDSSDSSNSNNQKKISEKLFSPKYFFSSKIIFFFTEKTCFCKKKSQILIKLKYSNCDETQKLKL